MTTKILEICKNKITNIVDIKQKVFIINFGKSQKIRMDIKSNVDNLLVINLQNISIVILKRRNRNIKQK